MNSKMNRLWIALALGFGMVVGNSWADDNAAVHPAPAIIHAKLSLIAGHIDGQGSVDGLGQQAQFGLASSDLIANAPMGITSDPEGNLYVADESNHTIRKISKEGVVTTIAGKAGVLGSADGMGADARFNYPAAIAIDKSGNLYVADSANHTIRKITSAGIVSTLAGKAGVFGSVSNCSGDKARFKHPEGIAVDSQGIIYVADTLNDLVHRITPDGQVTNIAHALHKGEFPHDLVIDSTDEIYVTNRGSHTVGRINLKLKSNFVSGFIEGGGDGVYSPGETAHISNPVGLGIDRDFLYVSTDSDIRRIARSGALSYFVGQDQPGEADGLGKQASFFTPSGVTEDKNGNLYVTTDALVRKITPSGLVTTIAGRPEVYGSANGIGAEAKFHGLIQLAADKLGNLYVTDRMNNLVRKIDKNGVVTTLAGNLGKEGVGYADGIGNAVKFGYPSEIAVDPIGNVYINELENSVIRKIDPRGVVTTIAGNASKNKAINSSKQSVDLDSYLMTSDNQGNIYFIDSKTTIRKIDAAGIMTTFVGVKRKEHEEVDLFHDVGSDGVGSNARFVWLQGLTADKLGNLYVIDDNTIRKVTPTGVVSTLGNYSEEEVSSFPIEKFYSFKKTKGLLYHPNTIAADEEGNVYFTIRSKIKKINQQGLVVAEIDASSPELGALNTLKSPSSMVFLDSKNLALIIGNAVVKITF